MGQDGKCPDVVAYGLEICAWIQQSAVKEPFLSQITHLQNSLQNIVSNPAQPDKSLPGILSPNMEQASRILTILRTVFGAAENNTV